MKWLNEELDPSGRWALLIYKLVSFSLRRHQHRKRHIDELFVLADCVQSAAHVAGNLRRSALLDPKRQLHDGGLKGELILVDLEKQGREKV